MLDFLKNTFVTILQFYVDVLDAFFVPSTNDGAMQVVFLAFIPAVVTAIVLAVAALVVAFCICGMTVNGARYAVRSMRSIAPLWAWALWAAVLSVACPLAMEFASGPINWAVAPGIGLLFVFLGVVCLIPHSMSPARRQNHCHA